MTIVERGMGLALDGLRQLAGLEVLDRLGLRSQVEGLVRSASRNGAQAGTSAARAFGQAKRQLRSPSRQSPVDRSVKGLFDLTPSDEQTMLREAFRDFAAARLAPAARAADDACEAPTALLEEANALGALVLGIPSDLGGVVDERSAVTTVLAAEALASGDLGIAAAILAPASVATLLALHGDADQQGTYLPAFTGDAPPVAALAVMEPRALFDPSAPRTTARREGGDLVLHGVKSTVLRGGAAELFLVSVTLDGGPALVLLEGGAAGASFVAEPTIGARATASGELTLDGVRVPAAALLAEGDPQVHAEMVARARIAWAALAVGAAQSALDHVIPYVKERKAFGESIATRQGVAFPISNMAIELEGLRLATWRAAALADAGKPFTRAAAIARQLTTRHALQIGSDAVQLLGGHGYVKEHPVERWYRDLRLAGIVEGGLAV